MAGNLYFALGRASVLDFRRFTQSAIIIMSLLTFARVAMMNTGKLDWKWSSRYSHHVVAGGMRRVRLRMWHELGHLRGGVACNFFTSNWCIPVDKLTSMEDNWKIRLASRSKIVWELAAEKSWMWYAWLKTWHKFFKKKKKSPTYLSRGAQNEAANFWAIHG